jgi:carbonic anhydrase/acetyltransferase-like protein (isoleucine patch superfamily)
MATLKPPSSRPVPTGPPKAPLKADPTATIADTAVFQGTYPVTIGAGTIIHPRARFYAYEGPIYVGDGCIISEKATIGAQPSRSSENKETATRLSYFVTIGPSSTVHPGAHIHSSATIEALATINRDAEIGSHSKICSGCEVPEKGRIDEWVVIYGSGLGQRRKRAREAKEPGPAVVVAAEVAQLPVPRFAPRGKVIEDARLMVLQKEREVLARMIVPAGAKKK